MLWLAEAVVSPCWASSFWQSPQKEPKGLAPPSGSRCARLDSLRSPCGPAFGCYFASLRFFVPSLLQGLAAKGHPWPIAALGSGILLRSTSCIHAIVAASMPLNPLRNDYARPADGAFVLARVDGFGGAASWLLLCRMGEAGRYPCGWVIAWLMGIAALNPSYGCPPNL